VLRTLKAHTGGCRITRLSYGSNMPLDRMRKVANKLVSSGLIATRTDDSRIYVITTRGLEFLDAFKKLAGFLE